MKANEFVKKFGWDLVKRDIACLESGFITKSDFMEHYGFEILDDLKRLVESWELVESYGGIDSLNDLFIVHGMSHARVMKVGGLTYADAMQAIADVESCND